jgi:hypothetical protein
MQVWKAPDRLWMEKSHADANEKKFFCTFNLKRSKIEQPKTRD